MVSRRDFFKAGAAVAAASVVVPEVARAHEPDDFKSGVAVSPWSGVEYKAVPTVCTQCPSRCPAIGFVDDKRLAKLQGNPASVRTQGKLCARGQASIEQVYDPDRILWPLKRAGKRGEGKWQRVSWDVALQELGRRLKQLRDGGTPERVMVQHGWLSAGSERLLKDVFLPSYGTATVCGPESLGRSARRVAHQLTWGDGEDNWDVANARFILNVGSNFLEAHTNHIAIARRYAEAAASGRVRMVTLDVRLSNTAARSQDWVPVRPGTDLAVLLSMCQVIVAESLYKGDGERFLEFCRVTPEANASVADKVAALAAHLKDYTPEWAQGVSGVPVERIRSLAREFATTKPACVVSHRGASAHANGVDTERAIQMLAALTGTIDVPGGRCRAVRGKWDTPKAPAGTPAPRRLEVVAGPVGQVALPLDGVGHAALRLIKGGTAGRPEVLIWHGHNPVFANGDPATTEAILKDETALPFTVAVTPFYDETAALADLILPDATYLESWDLEEAPAADQIAEYLIRQPVIEPLGEARDFKDVLCELARVIGLPIGVESAEAFVREACKLTPDVKKKANGFNGMKKAGVWRDKKAEPLYRAFAAPVTEEALGKPGVLFDEATGVYWNWKTAGAASEDAARAAGYANTPGAGAGYMAQRVAGTAVAGFPPGKVAKTGLFELYSAALAAKGLPALPTWRAIAVHDSLPKDQLMLVTFKTSVHAQGRSQNSRWLDEIAHDNPVWINGKTAADRGIRDGDRVRLASPVGQVTATARVTETIMPGVLAMSGHNGHRAYGRFASAAPSPTGVDDAKLRSAKWWAVKGDGAHANAVIPVTLDPVAGQQCWMDAVVTLDKA